MRVENTNIADQGDDNNNTDVVKSGDLSVTATPATNRKVIIGGVSDLDTIKFTSNEKITLNKITLDRYGYSNATWVTVWLEDEEGNKVTNERPINNKDEIVLTLKKDYKELDKNDILTIVARVDAWTPAGTIGFQVKSVDSSAANTDLSKYTPYQYDMIVYNGTKVSIEAKGKARTYHYTEGDSYEVARIQVKASNAAIVVNGFSFENKGSLDLSDFVDKVTVTADGKEVSGVKYTAKKRDFKVTFNDTNIDINKKATFVVNVTLKGLDELGKDVQLVLNDYTDINAVETKTQARVEIEALPDLDKFPVYTFNGGKITLSNTKLAATIDAAQGSEDVVVGEGKVELGGEGVELNDFTVAVPMVEVSKDWKSETTEYKASSYKSSPLSIKSSQANLDKAIAANWDCTKTTIPAECKAKPAVQAVQNMSIVVNGEEFDGTLNTEKTAFVFKDVVIEKSGTIKFVVDIEDNDDLQGSTITIDGIFNKAALTKNEIVGEYSDSGEDVKATDFIGSISLSNVKVQAAKWALKNNDTKKVEVVRGSTSSNVVLFNGTYTAKKGDVYLNEFLIKELDGKSLEANEDLTFNLEIEGKPVASISMNGSEGSEYFSDDVLVKKWESVKVVVKADVYAEDKADKATFKYELTLKWEDENGVEAGTDSADLVAMDLVSNGSVTVSETSSDKNNTLKLTSSNLTLADFVVKPSNKSSNVDLTSVVLVLSGESLSTDGTAAPVLEIEDVEKYLSVEIEGDKDFTVKKEEGTGFVITIDDFAEPVDVSLNVEVKYDSELPAGKYTITVDTVNGKKQWTKFKTAVAPAVVHFTQTGDNDITKFTAEVETNDSAYTVKNISLMNKKDGDKWVSVFWSTDSEYAHGTTKPEEVSNEDKITYMEYASFVIVSSNEGEKDITVELTYNEYKDFFYDGSNRLKISKSKDN